MLNCYRGNPTAWDIFHLKRYIAETDYQRSQIEPSTLFNKRITNDFNQMNEELIDTLKPIEKLRAYWKSGQTTKALSTIERSLEQYPERTQDIIGVLAEFRSVETMEKLRELLRNPALVDMHRTIVDVMAFFPHPTITHILLSELNRGGFYPPKVRLRMVEALERISHTDFADAAMNTAIKSSLTALLNDQVPAQSTEEEKGVRLIAARTLMRLGEPRGVEELITLAKEPPSRTSDGQSRLGSSEALDALTGSRDEKVVAFLKAQLQLDVNKAPWMRGRTIDALAQIGDPEIIEWFGTLLDNDSVPLRQKAAQTLGRTGTPIEVHHLLGRLKSDRGSRDKKEEEEDEQPVRRSIVEALGRIANNSAHQEDRQAVREAFLQDVLPAFHTNPTHSMVRTTTEALGRIGNATTYQALVSGTGMLNPLIRIEALEALDDIRAIDHFKQELKEGTSHTAEIQQRLAVALGRLGDASAVTPLLSVLQTTQERLLDANTGKMRLSVVGVLGRLGHKNALDPLQKMVEHGRC